MAGDGALYEVSWTRLPATLNTTISPACTGALPMYRNRMSPGEGKERHSKRRGELQCAAPTADSARAHTHLCKMTAPCCRSTPQQPGARGVRLLCTGHSPQFTHTGDSLPVTTISVFQMTRADVTINPGTGTQHTKGREARGRESSVRAEQVLSTQHNNRSPAAAVVLCRGTRPLPCGDALTPRRGCWRGQRRWCAPRDTSCCTSSLMFMPRSVASVSFTNSRTMDAMATVRSVEGKRAAT